MIFHYIVGEIMENKRLNIILITISIIIFLVILYMLYLIIDNESARQYFNINDIRNIKWVNTQENIELNVDKDTIKLIIAGEDVLNDNYDFNRTTGEFILKDRSEKLYLRNIEENSIVIWYEKAEYRLTKSE